MLLFLGKYPYCAKKPVVHGAMGSGQKNFVSVAVPPAPVRVPSQRPLAPSVASVKSVTNDKGGNPMILRAVHRSPGICLTAEQNPRKPQLGSRRPSNEGAVRPVIVSNGVLFIQMRSIGSHSTSGREKEGNKERTAKCNGLNR